jgi:hypothetical protein
VTVALLHAYRAANRGDGWLVDLSRQLVRDATGEEPIVYALDPAGMGPGATAVFPPPVRPRAAAAALLSSSGLSSRLAAAVMDLPDPGDLDAAIGIGGGYLRCTDPVHELVFRAHHLPQLRLVARMGRKGAYLPVSVGPFRRGLGRTVRRALAATGWVAARDDRTARYLAGWSGGRRVADLAACRIGVDRPALRPGEPGVVGVVLRSLPRSDLGFATVSMLEERGLKVRFGVQSSSGRTNDDRSFYAARGVLDQADDFGHLLDSSPRPSVIVAGRLHAALDAIAAGIPTIHLGYERKSVGAFDDLGLADYVIDAWTGQPGQLADRLVELATDPAPYWERLSTRFDPLANQWSQLSELVGRLVSAPAGPASWGAASWG